MQAALLTAQGNHSSPLLVFIHPLAAPPVPPHILHNLSLELHSKVVISAYRCSTESYNTHYFSSSLTISCPDCGHTSILPPEGVRQSRKWIYSHLNSVKHLLSMKACFCGTHVNATGTSCYSLPYILHV